MIQEKVLFTKDKNYISKTTKNCTKFANFEAQIKLLPCPFLPKRCSHHRSFVAKLLVVIVDFSNTKDTRIF